MKTILALHVGVGPISIAIYHQHKLIETSRPSSREDCENLISCISVLADYAEVNFSDFDGIIVSTGPGPYTGIRLGITTATTMGLALDIPVVGVSTLEALLHPSRHQTGVYFSVIGGCRGEMTVGLFAVRDGHIDRLSHDTVITESGFVNLVQSMAEPPRVIGDIPSVVLGPLENRCTPVTVKMGSYAEQLGTGALKFSDFIQRPTPVYSHAPIPGKIKNNA